MLPTSGSFSARSPDSAERQAKNVHLEPFLGGSEQPEYAEDARLCPVPLGGRANTRAPR